MAKDNRRIDRTSTYAEVLRDDLSRFYEIIEELKKRQGGMLSFEAAERRQLQKVKGIYFIFEAGEWRGGGEAHPRVVRVGTHGVTTGTKSTLWSRLSQHRGSTSGGGNHRTSIFRRHVGTALQRSGVNPLVPGWEIRKTAPAAQQEIERAIEARVSQLIRAMHFLWLPLDDDEDPETGPGTRGYMERNAIALLASASARQADPSSASWLGRHAESIKISSSGLWNVRHVGEPADAEFLERFESAVRFISLKPR